VRATNLLVAAWMLAFSIPLLVRARGESATPGGAGIGDALDAIGRSFREVRRFTQAVGDSSERITRAAEDLERAAVPLAGRAGATGGAGEAAEHAKGRASGRSRR